MYWRDRMRKLEYKGSSKILLQIVEVLNGLIQAVAGKANLPLTEGSIDYGLKGQLLSSEGDGSTSWIDVGGSLTDFVTREEVGQLILQFLDDGDISRILGITLKNTLAEEQTSATTISAEFSPLGGGLVMAVLVHRSKLTETPDGWELLMQTEGIADGDIKNQYVSIFYCETLEQLVQIQFSQETAARFYLNMFSFLGAGTPYLASEPETQTTDTIQVCKTTNDPVIWIVHRIMWSSGKWEVDGVPEDRVVQRPEAGRLLCAFDKSVQKRITFQPSSKNINLTEFFAIGIPGA